MDPPQPPPCAWIGVQALAAGAAAVAIPNDAIVIEIAARAAPIFLLLFISYAFLSPIKVLVWVQYPDFLWENRVPHTRHFLAEHRYDVVILL